MASLESIKPQTNESERFENLKTFAVEALVTVVRACLGSLLGMSTVALFAAYGVTAMTGVSFGTSVTIIALGLNGLLLSLVALGALTNEFEPVVEEAV